MTDHDSTALARRLVACPNFRWLPGMLAISASGLHGPARGLHGPARIESIDGDSYGTTVIPHAGGPIFAGHHEWSVLGEFPREHTVPDLADAATLGCLLQLVREAFGDCHLHVRPWKTAGACEHKFGYWLCRISGDPLNIARVGYSEAEALVAALEAASK